jgi:hypothetical protein
MYWEVTVIYEKFQNVIVPEKTLKRRLSRGGGGGAK